MPMKWVPPKIFFKLDKDTTVYYAYKDERWEHELIYHYNLSYYEEDEWQIDVQVLSHTLGQKKLSDADAVKLRSIRDKERADPNGRSWHRGIIRLAHKYALFRVPGDKEDA